MRTDDAVSLLLGLPVRSELCRWRIGAVVGRVACPPSTVVEDRALEILFASVNCFASEVVFEVLSVRLLPKIASLGHLPDGEDDGEDWSLISPSADVFLACILPDDVRLSDLLAVVGALEGRPFLGDEANASL